MKHANHDLASVSRCSRRNLWRALLQEAFVTQDALRGQPGFRLSELGSLPDEQLAQIRPIVNPEYEIFVEEGYVCSRYKKTKATQKLFPLKRENVVAFDLFNGQHSLAEVGARLAQEMGWDEARGFAHARDLFLSLVERLACVPANPL